ncbi:hypothetical protein [uncultured Microbacterium sp.]|uniref:hypothetical protein n=1 Tax=uncultured Microbacterium sp. TaxID=191216 RepID=UPI0028E49989|nr:hypothetical protein [uncultured Microbacterium sp.]
MSSRRASAATKRIARGTAQFERRAGRDRINGVNGTTVRFRTIPSSTGIDSSSVIHILDKRRYRASVDVLRMPTRRPTREPFRPCPVAVLKDQEA